MVAPRGARDRSLQMDITSRRLLKDKLPKPRRTTEEVSVPIAHRKRFPAKRANEQTRVPPDNQFRVRYEGIRGVRQSADGLDQEYAGTGNQVEAPPQSARERSRGRHERVTEDPRSA